MTNQPRHRDSSTSTDNTVVRLSGTEGVIIAIPQCLGFEPDDSLVLVCFTGPRHRISLVARMDIPVAQSDVHDHATYSEMLRAAKKYADEVAVVCYHSGDRPSAIDTLQDALAARSIRVGSVHSVSQGIIRSAETMDEYRGDPGTSVPSADDPQRGHLAAAAALSGRQILPSRSVLRKSIAPPTGSQLELMQRELLKAQRRWPHFPRNRTTLPSKSISRRLDQLLRAALAEFDKNGHVTAATAADLMTTTSNVSCRDHVMARIVTKPDVSIMAALISIAALCPQESSPGWCSVLAYGAYFHGDGALALCALERVLEQDPDHRLAQLLLTALSHGLPPAGLGEIYDLPAEPFHWRDSPTAQSA